VIETYKTGFDKPSVRAATGDQYVLSAVAIAPDGKTLAAIVAGTARRRRPGGRPARRRRRVVLACHLGLAENQTAALVRMPTKSAPMTSSSRRWCFLPTANSW